MRFKEFDEISHFGDAIFFWCVVDDVPKKYIDKAIKMDENSCPSNCFYACLIFEQTGLHFNKQDNGELYYIGSDGSPYYLEVTFKKEEKETFFYECYKTLIKNIPRERDKIVFHQKD